MVDNIIVATFSSVNAARNAANAIDDLKEYRRYEFQIEIWYHRDQRRPRRGVGS